MLAFGEGPFVYAFVFSALTIASFVISLLTAGAIMIGGRFLPNRFSRWATATALLIGTAGGVAYMFLYPGRQPGVWIWPLMLGAFVFTLTTYLVIGLIRWDGQWPRLKLRTLLLLMAVIGVILATIAPAFTPR